ncbi:MAG: hypothetical protein ABII12_06030 [Planctomycetota bacterium]
MSRYMRLPAATLVALSLSSAAQGQTVIVTVSSPQDGSEVLPETRIVWTVTASVSPPDSAGLALISLDLVQAPTNPVTIDIPPADAVPAGMENFSSPEGISNPGEGGFSSGYVGVQRGPPGGMNLKQIGGGQNTSGQPGVTFGTNANVLSGIGQGGLQLIASGSFTAPATFGIYVYSIENIAANVLNLADPPPEPPSIWPTSKGNVSTPGPSFSFTVIEEVACTPGDVNGDDVIDGKDIQPFVSVFLEPGNASSQAFCAADLNENGILDCNDLILFLGAILGFSPGNGPTGDVNNDGVTDGNDIQLFVGVLLDPCGASPKAFHRADCDGDGLVTDLHPEIQHGFMEGSGG